MKSKSNLMNAAVRSHYNTLLAASKPIMANLGTMQVHISHDYRCIPDVGAACLAALNRAQPEALAQEITAAARENRMADADQTGPWKASSERLWGMVVGVSGYVKETQTRVFARAVQLAKAEITAIVTESDRVALERYEAYRALCEQGVALAPGNGEEVGGEEGEQGGDDQS